MTEPIKLAPVSYGVPGQIVTIRGFNPDTDRESALDMGIAFLESSIYGTLLGGSNREGMSRLIDGLVRMGPNAFLEVATDEAGEVFGMLAAIISLHPLNGAPVCEEVCWWVEPAARGARQIGPMMLERLEVWARGMNARLLKMVAPADRHGVSRFYVKVGYAPMEAAYVKALR